MNGTKYILDEKMNTYIKKTQETLEWDAPEEYFFDWLMDDKKYYFDENVDDYVF